MKSNIAPVTPAELKSVCGGTLIVYPTADGGTTVYDTDAGTGTNFFPDGTVVEWDKSGPVRVWY